MNSIYLFFSALFLLTAISCRKEPGEGGHSSIWGKVWVKHYDPSTNSIIGEYAGGFYDVYLIYGDDITYEEKTEATPEGIFEFKYLRPGKYKVYTYSKDVSQPFNSFLPDKMIMQEIQIEEKRQVVETDTFAVYHYEL